MEYKFIANIKSNADLLGDGIKGIQSVVELKQIMEQTRVAQIELDELQQMMAFKAAIIEGLLKNKPMEM